MNHSYESLFEAIRARCQREGWYGPELLSPTNREAVPANDPNRFGFVLPPASEEQLQETEAHLGFPLPPLLRALYASVANGGFGPGTGLRGACGGYEGGYINHDGKIVFQYQWRSHKGTFNYTTYQEQSAQAVARGEAAHMAAPYGEWLDRLLPICDIGCNGEICVDSQERMFLVGPLKSNEVYGLFQLSWTLEEWLWRWTKDEDIYSWP